MKYEYHELANGFPLIEGEEYESLKQDIKQNGLKLPVYLYEGKILDGRNRYRACLDVGIEPRFEEYKGTSPTSFVISLNEKRRHLTPSQRATVAVFYLPFLEKEALKRKTATLNKGELAPLAQFCPNGEIGKATEKAGKILNVSPRYVQEAKKLQKERPELFEEVKKGTMDFSDIKKLERKEKIERQKEEIKNLEPEKKMRGVYDVVVIDPPWGMEGDYSPDGRRGIPPYPTMTYEQIEKIKIPSSENCVLWLWVKNKDVHEAYHLLELWGFAYKNIMTWGKQHYGLGDWLRNQTEHCLLAVKGKPLFTGGSSSTLLLADRGGHSVKPEEFYKLVEKTCHGRKLDYFARKKREGWDVYGDEVKE